MLKTPPKYLSNRLHKSARAGAAHLGLLQRLGHGRLLGLPLPARLLVQRRLVPLRLARHQLLQLLLRGGKMGRGSGGGGGEAGPLQGWAPRRVPAGVGPAPAGVGPAAARRCRRCKGRRPGGAPGAARGACAPMHVAHFAGARWRTCCSASACASFSECLPPPPFLFFFFFFRSVRPLASTGMASWESASRASRATEVAVRQRMVGCGVGKKSNGLGGLRACGGRGAETAGVGGWQAHREGTSGPEAGSEPAGERRGRGACRPPAAQPPAGDPCGSSPIARTAGCKPPQRPPQCPIGPGGGAGGVGGARGRPRSAPVERLVGTGGRGGEGVREEALKAWNPRAECVMMPDARALHVFIGGRMSHRGAPARLLARNSHCPHASGATHRPNWCLICKSRPRGRPGGRAAAGSSRAGRAQAPSPSLPF